VAKKTYHIRQYAINSNEEFEIIHETFSGTVKAGKPPFLFKDARAKFTVINNLATGSIYISEWTGNGEQHERLVQMLITGTDPGNAATKSRWMLMTENTSVLLESPTELTPTEWSDLLKGAGARWDYILDLPEDARMRLEKSEQIAFGFDKATYILWKLTTIDGINRIPHNLGRFSGHVYPRR